MQIRADFDSGNIQVIDASDPRRIRLAIRPDLASQHFQWFHFKVEGMAAATEHRFTLVNAGQSAYSHAWSGYQAVASYDGERWFRVPSQYDADGLHFQLEPEESEVRFAYFEPYSRERHARLVERALGIEGVERLAVGTSVQGRDIELLRVRRHPDSHLKLWVIAQQHPGEHMAEWFMEGLIERLQRPDDTEMQRLLEKADLYLVPNMNPDGAFHGNLRTNAAGQDLNRAWLEPSAERSPEVWFVQQEMKRHGVDLFLDIHGDEEIPPRIRRRLRGQPGLYAPPGTARATLPRGTDGARRIPDPPWLPTQCAGPGQPGAGLQLRRADLRLPGVHHRDAVQGPRRQPGARDRLVRRPLQAARPGRPEHPCGTGRRTPLKMDGAPRGAPFQPLSSR